MVLVWSTVRLGDERSVFVGSSDEGKGRTRQWRIHVPSLQRQMVTLKSRKSNVGHLRWKEPPSGGPQWSE